MKNPLKQFINDLKETLLERDDGEFGPCYEVAMAIDNMDLSYYFGLDKEEAVPLEELLKKPEVRPISEFFEEREMGS